MTPRRAHPLLRLLARAVLGVFFRQVAVEGVERVPRDRPLVFVANHVNALVDPALLLAYLPVAPRFLAKSTLWQMAALRPFLALAAAIPVYRRQDPGVDPGRNEATFARCHEVLAAGGAIALFPEGRSHDEPALVPLKTGVSRIVLDAEAAYGGLGTRIVAVGLNFEDKGRFRSRVLLQVGEPVDPAPELAARAADPEGAVRRLTERVRAALAAVTLSYPSWEEARWIERAAELYERPLPELPGEPAPDERFAVRRAFVAGYRQLRQRHPAAVERAAAAVAAYDELLALYGLRDAQVAARYPAAGVLRFVGKSLGLLLVRAPLAAIGTVLHWLPYRAVDRVARRWGTTPDLLATYKLFASLLAYPATWLALGGLAAWRLGPAAGVAAFLVGPPSGYVALRFHERRGYFWREARAYLLLRSGRRSVAELRRRRRCLVEAVAELVGLYRAMEAAAGSSAEASRQ